MEDFDQQTEGAEVRACRDCGTAFSLPDTEKDWFAQRGLSLPVRCKGCRALRRAQNAAAAAVDWRGTIERRGGLQR